MPLILNSLLNNFITFIYSSAIFPAPIIAIGICFFHCPQRYRMMLYIKTNYVIFKVINNMKIKPKKFMKNLFLVGSGGHF